jgi:zinc finger protein
VKYNTDVKKIPYLKEVVITTIMCGNCDYKYSDVMITSQDKPMEYKIKVNCLDDLTIRVIRSSTATIELLELGIKIEPASAADAFISNIEGVLVRTYDAIENVKRFSDEPEKIKKSEELLEKINGLRNGEGEVTLIIQDPMGNSGILSDMVEKRELSGDEVSGLETGLTIIDINDIKID